MPRRLAAIVYDGLLLFALWMAASAVVVILRQDEIPAASPWFQAYLIAVAWLYLAFCWRAGQTLGMKAWRIHIMGTPVAGKPGTVSWSATLIRFATAMLSWGMVGIGFLWSLFHPHRATWHDLASGTQLVVMPRTTSKAPQKHQADGDDQDRRQHHRKP